MTSKISLIIDTLKTLTLIETVELISQLEKIFNITSANLVVSNVANTTDEIKEANTTNVEKEEQTAFTILLNEVPADKKIAVLKIVRNVTGLGLKESKEIVDNPPKIIKENITKEESETIKKEFENLGAKIEIK